MAKAPSNKVTAGDVQDLAVAVEQLTEETRLLRMSLDELRDDVVWAARQVLTAGYQISGTPPPLPRDPLAPDMDVAAARPTTPTFEHATDHLIETGPYCCDKPRLGWNGDPDAPGVMCENCGYVIAENGSVVIWRAGEQESEAEQANTPTIIPTDRQGSLFN